MFDPRWQAIDARTAQALRREIEPLAPFRYPQRYTLRRRSLDFYEGYDLLSLSEDDRPAPNERFILHQEGSVPIFLDWSNAPIYRLNEQLSRQGKLLLGRRTAADYIQFFFHFVRGQLGRFLLVDRIEQVPWTPDASPAIKEKVGRQLKRRLEYLGHYKGNSTLADFYEFRGSVIFKNALFQSSVLLAPYNAVLADEEGEENFTPGQLKLTNEELQLEDLPVIIDPPPGEFG